MRAGITRKDVFILVPPYGAVCEDTNSIECCARIRDVRSLLSELIQESASASIRDRSTNTGSVCWSAVNPLGEEVRCLNNNRIQGQIKLEEGNRAVDEGSKTGSVEEDLISKDLLVVKVLFIGGTTSTCTCGVLLILKNGGAVGAVSPSLLLCRLSNYQWVDFLETIAECRRSGNGTYSSIASILGHGRALSINLSWVALEIESEITMVEPVSGLHTLVLTT